LSEGLAAFPGASLAAPTEANEVFVTLPRVVIDGLKAAGALFYGWPEPWADSPTIRLVTRHDMSDAEVDGFLRLAEKLSRR